MSACHSMKSCCSQGGRSVNLASRKAEFVVFWFVWAMFVTTSVSPNLLPVHRLDGKCKDGQHAAAKNSDFGLTMQFIVIIQRFRTFRIQNGG